MESFFKRETGQKKVFGKVTAGGQVTTELEDKITTRQVQKEKTTTLYDLHRSDKSL